MITNSSLVWGAGVAYRALSAVDESVAVIFVACADVGEIIGDGAVDTVGAHNSV
jgi:hypothetical protein